MVTPMMSPAIRTVTGWTDYPFVALGDVPSRRAPIRKVLVIYYDGNKYVGLRVKGIDSIVEIKSGYVYRTPGRSGRVPALQTWRMPRRMRPDKQEMGL